jgi:hypothetical protein
LFVGVGKVFHIEEITGMMQRIVRAVNRES